MKRYSLNELKAAWPEVAEALRPKPRPAPKRMHATLDVASTYVEAALTGEWQAVKNSREGTRNPQLNRSAFNLGTLVGAGLVTDDEAIGTLLDAVSRQAKPLPDGEARRTIHSGLEAGKQHPRSTK